MKTAFHEPASVFCECRECRQRQRGGAWVLAGIGFVLVCAGIAIGLVIATHFFCR